VRTTVARWPLIAALKRVLAHTHDEPRWQQVRPPLQPLTPQEGYALIQALARQGWRAPK